MPSEDAQPRTLLTATDFSENAMAAMEWAADLARMHGWKLIVVNALSPYELAPGVTEYVVNPPDFHEQIRLAHQNRLDEVVEGLKAGGVDATAELVMGVAGISVPEAAERLGVDLVVLGTRGKTGFSRIVLGSTAARIIQHCHCPVLTIHPHDVKARRPIRTVLAPTDFSHDAEQATYIASHLLDVEHTDSRLILLNVYHLPTEFVEFEPSDVTIRLFKDTEKETLARLETMAAPLREMGFRVECVAREGYPVEVIENCAREFGADLIAMGTHGRTGLRHMLLGSVAERVMPHAPCPVLTVRQKD